ncbi:TetR/AcrR family transcriptional regulator [Mycobacterium kansasii]|uniref:Bacterial regulatory s, tetR family protein n=3 Tax=Mycobacterium kansasii TaxID=1768 RepID=A0A1V3XIJ2_MYCKA|nr:TetR/AcrR family transcriptional regulator [Mycobacterium kansasii]EUA01631.1 bacterial regulatory s, tetR family protein [Mycobacterium kansasii 824]AGZ50282.1 TetR family transcriptional regulator [Mycobacterium kansasii ATCC 12478]ARG57880.1 TetR family transcriptional regulator [Mycobacterium kansasii]ARG63394.1 TetR family transcriptional regulator [Mycobacterium kansasii]ARG71031.1 TetR family transcriptional regulator [Mycobacterium kansasii]
MSGITFRGGVDRPIQRRRDKRAEQSVRRLLDAAVEELAESPYAELTVRGVAARAAVSPTTAYTYFKSKDTLIGEVYLRLLHDADTFVDVNDNAETRVKAQLRELLLLVADMPYLADACTTAIMADDPVMDDIRGRIAVEVSRRITASLGPGAATEVAATLHMVFSGAQMHARSTAGGYRAVADKLDDAVSLIMNSQRDPHTAGKH